MPARLRGVTRRFLATILIVPATPLVACGSETGDDGGIDATAPRDADADVVAEADADAETETDAGAGADAETDADADADTAFDSGGEAMPTCPGVPPRGPGPDPGYFCCPLDTGSSCSGTLIGGSIDDPDAAGCPRLYDYGGHTFRYCLDAHGCVHVDGLCVPDDPWMCGPFGSCYWDSGISDG